MITFDSSSLFRTQQIRQRRDWLKRNTNRTVEIRKTTIDGYGIEPNKITYKLFENGFFVRDLRKDEVNYSLKRATSVKRMPSYNCKKQTIIVRYGSLSQIKKNQKELNPVLHRSRGLDIPKAKIKNVFGVENMKDISFKKLIR